MITIGIYEYSIKVRILISYFQINVWNWEFLIAMVWQLCKIWLWNKIFFFVSHNSIHKNNQLRKTTTILCTWESKGEGRSDRYISTIQNLYCLYYYLYLKKINSFASNILSCSFVLNLHGHGETFQSSIRSSSCTMYPQHFIPTRSKSLTPPQLTATTFFPSHIHPYLERHCQRHR